MLRIPLKRERVASDSLYYVIEKYGGKQNERLRSSVWNNEKEYEAD